MKNLIIALLIATSLSAQERLSIFVPKQTVHFDKSLVNIIPSEGGRYGIVASYTLKNCLVHSAGIFENSYGDLSPVYTFGWITGTLKSSLSFHIGVAGNYFKAHTDKSEGSFLRTTGLMPVTLLTYKWYFHEHVGLQFNLSPIYLNVGIVFKIK
jgi:hypothetical protein